MKRDVQKCQNLGRNLRGKHTRCPDKSIKMQRCVYGREREASLKPIEILSRCATARSAYGKTALVWTKNRFEIQDISLCKSMVKAGLRLLFPTLDQDLLCYLRLTPSQIKPNDWRYFLSYCILWPLVLGEDTSLTLKKFPFLYHPVSYDWLWNIQV
jgi:hypothetical protein